MKGSSDSAVNRRKAVSKSVLVPEELGSSRKHVCVMIPVDNLLAASVTIAGRYVNEFIGNIRTENEENVM